MPTRGTLEHGALPDEVHVELAKVVEDPGA